MAQSTGHAAATATLQKEISHLRHELKTTAESHLSASKQIRVGDYLIERLVQLGVTVKDLSSTSDTSKPLLDRPSSVSQETSTLVSTNATF